MITESFGDAEPVVLLAEMRSCNGTVAAGEHLVHSRYCPVHGDTTQRDLDAELADLTAAAEARGYRKAITALRDESDRQLGYNHTLSVAYAGSASFLEAIAEEGK